MSASTSSSSISAARRNSTSLAHHSNSRTPRSNFDIRSPSSAGSQNPAQVQPASRNPIPTRSNPPESLQIDGLPANAHPVVTDPPPTARPTSKNRVYHTAPGTLQRVKNKINRSLHEWFPSHPAASDPGPEVIRFGSLEILRDDPPQLTTPAQVGDRPTFLPAPPLPQTQVPMAQPSQEPQSIFSSLGDSFPTIDPSQTLRVIYQNTWHSLQPTAAPPTAQLLQHLQELQCGIFCAAESNINWRNKSATSAFRDMITRAGCRNTHISPSCSLFGTFDEHIKKPHLPGGTVTVSFDIWASKVIDFGEDPDHMGRWSFASYKGKNTNVLTVITGYRTCRAGPSSGPTTAHSQQMFIAAQRSLNNLDTAGPSFSPRAAFLQDITKTIRGFQTLGHSIILCIDGNETPSACRGLDGSLKRDTMDTLLFDLGLEEVFERHHGTTVDTSTTTENRFIDRVAVWNVPLVRVGRLPVNIPARSDHLAFALDIDANALFGGRISPLASLNQRQLTTKNERSRSAYESDVLWQCHSHNLLARIQTLSAMVDDGTFDDAAREALFRIDQQFTEIRLGAERRCSSRRPQRFPWSPVLKQTGKAIVYWQQRISLLPNLPTVALIRIGSE